MASSMQSRLGTTPNEGIKFPCLISTSVNITLSGEQTVNSVAAVAGNRILVKDQADTTENGIYDVATGVWARATDCNDAQDLVNGVMVLDYTNSTLWQAVFTGTYDPGTTSLTWDRSLFDVASGAITTIIDDNLTASRALTSNASGKVAVATTTQTELELLNGLTALTNVVATKTAGQSITPTAGASLFITSSDGGSFVGVTGAAPGTYADDGGDYCGTVFLPTGGDGSAAWVRDYNSLIKFEWFGVFGVSPYKDNKDTLQVLRAFLVANNDNHYTLDLSPGAEYQYSEQFWLRGVKNISIRGNGAKLKNINGGFPTDGSVAYTLTLNPGFFGDMDAGDASTAVTKLGDYIDTVVQGSNTITLKTTPEAVKYPATTRIFIYGGNLYTGGYPLSPKTFEWAVVESVDLVTGVITLEHPIKHSYRDDWNESASGTEAGKARVKSLDGTDGFIGGESIYIENLDFIGINPSSAYTKDRGYLNTGSFKNVYLKNVSADSIVPSMSDIVILDDCTVRKTMEIDKMIYNLSIKNKTYVHRTTEGTGCINYIAEDSVFGKDDLFLRAKNKIFKRCSIYSVSDVGGIISAASLYSWNGQGSLIFEDNNITAYADVNYSNGEVLSALLFRRVGVVAITPTDAGGTTVEITTANTSLGTQIYLEVGHNFQVKSTGVSGVVTGMRGSGVYPELTLEIQCDGLIVAGNQLDFNTNSHMSIKNNKLIQTDTNFLEIGLFAEPIIFDNRFQEIEFIISRDYFILRSHLFHYYATIKRMEITVLKAYTGTDTSPRLRVESLYGVGTPSSTVIDVTQTGMRVIDLASGALGAVGGDTLNLLNISTIHTLQFIKKGQDGYNKWKEDILDVGNEDRSKMPIIVIKLIFNRTTERY